jgi:hypothetical protein
VTPDDPAIQNTGLNHSLATQHTEVRPRYSTISGTRVRPRGPASYSIKVTGGQRSQISTCRSQARGSSYPGYRSQDKEYSYRWAEEVRSKDPAIQVTGLRPGDPAIHLFSCRSQSRVSSCPSIQLIAVRSGDPLSSLYSQADPDIQEAEVRPGYQTNLSTISYRKGYRGSRPAIGGCSCYRHGA